MKLSLLKYFLFMDKTIKVLDTYIYLPQSFPEYTAKESGSQSLPMSFPKHAENSCTAKENMGVWIPSALFVGFLPPLDCTTASNFR